MPVDDTDDKVRRNLVVFSALIVASAWLGHPELWLVTKLLSAEAVPPPAWKVSVLALAVLFYLFTRYWFSPTREKSRTTMDTELYRIRTTLLHKQLTNSVKNHHKTKKQPSFIKTDLASYVKDELETRNIASDLNVIVEIIPGQIFQSNEWKGSIHTTRSVTSPNRGGMSSGGNAIDFEIPQSMQQTLKITAALKQAIYSQTAVEFYTPLVLSAIAFLTLAYRLFRAVYRS